MKRILTLFTLMNVMWASAQTTYKNPVYASDFPYPSVQRCQDGYFYVYATGQRCLRSTDLVSWERLSNVISRPTWNDSTYIGEDGKQKTDSYNFWACDVNYVDGKYLMYYACALWGNDTRTGIGVATGTVPTAFTDKGKLFRSTEIGVKNSIDPCYVEEFDKKYLVWGSFHDIYISELSEDGLSIKNQKLKTKIGGGAFEGPMIHKRGNYYYLFCSVGSCCEGENSTYRTVVGRATKLTGPYYSKDGTSFQMYDNFYTTIIRGDDRWKGPGHNSEIITDDEGTDWIMYHSYDKNNGYDGRLLLLDKVTWDSNGWPVINNGFPSSDPQPRPVFYKDDGSVRTYRLTNTDFAKSKWKGWKTTFSEGANQNTGAGTAFMPLGYVKGACTFDIRQMATDMSNGLYEVEINAFDTEDNVEFCVNGLPTMIHDTTFVGTYPANDATISSNFLRGNYKRKAYGMVHDGKLVLQMRSRNPLSTTERFYVGNLKLVYRHQNEEVMATVLKQYESLIADVYAEGKPFNGALRTSVDDALTSAMTATTASLRYSRLSTLAKAVDLMQASIEVYDSLAGHVTLLQEKMAVAQQEGYLTEEAANVLAEAQGVLTNQDYTDLNVQKLITRMIKAGDDMIYTYQQGDGTAANPYIIIRPEQLLNMRNVLVRSQMVYFALESDIDLEGYEWTQLVGNSSQRYWINFDGRGHLIRNLRVEPGSGTPSFFGILAGECRNLGIIDADVRNTGAGAGILAGTIGMTTFKDADDNPLPCIVENCYVTGRVEGKDFAGGVAGTVANSPVIIRNVYANVDVVSTGILSNNSGGLVGRVRSELTIEKSYVAGTVIGPLAAPISGGGQSSSTAPSNYTNVIAWSSEIEGSKQGAPFAITAESDVLTNTTFFEEMLMNGEPVVGGKTHAELQQQAAQWGAPWYVDATAGNGYPILQWQYNRGDYRQMCGFPILDAIETPTARDAESGVIYDLMGRRVLNPERGLYIISGRKILVK